MSIDQQKNNKITKLTFDERRIFIHGGEKSSTIEYCVEEFISLANSALEQRGFFSVALSGGSTPKAIFALLGQESYQQQVNDWSKVFIFWGDERNVKPTDAQSNYKNALDAGLSKIKSLDLKNHVFRMEAEAETKQGLEEAAQNYAKQLETVLSTHTGGVLDMVMLGMGEDGHTASLFPSTLALDNQKEAVVANHVPQLDTFRMTMTYPTINAARHISVYVLGASKYQTLLKVFSEQYNPKKYPSQAIGTTTTKANWIVDNQAFPREKLIQHVEKHLLKAKH